MSSRASSASEPGTSAPGWLWELLGIETPPAEGSELEVRGSPFVLRNGILRAQGSLSEEQEQTSEAFQFKWAMRETFESDVSLGRMQEWLLQRYGNVANEKWWGDYGEAPVLLDAGCGAAMSALALLEPIIDRVRYLGVDVSGAVDVAARRFAEREQPAAFIQADITDLPLEPGSVDVIFSEGVLHHTDSTEEALHALARLLRPGGRFLFYVYRRKGPIREFTDDYVRDRLQSMDPEEAWDAMMSLTKLGNALGELDIEVEVPEEVPLLGISAGNIELQRLFYWYVCKAYYDPELSLDELNHINYDWYAPRNAHRQSPAEVREWCAEALLEIEREDVQEAGITVVAKKR